MANLNIIQINKKVTKKKENEEVRYDRWSKSCKWVKPKQSILVAKSRTKNYNIYKFDKRQIDDSEEEIMHITWKLGAQIFKIFKSDE